MSLVELFSWIAKQNWSQNPCQLITSPLNLEISNLGNLTFTLSFTGSGAQLEDGKLFRSTWILGLLKQNAIRLIRICSFYFWIKISSSSFSMSSVFKILRISSSYCLTFFIPSCKETFAEVSFKVEFSSSVEKFSIVSKISRSLFLILLR